MSIVLENEALSNRTLTKHFSSLEWRLQENHVGGGNCLQSVLANRIASLLAAEAFAYSQAVRLGMGIGVDAVEIKGDALTKALREASKFTWNRQCHIMPCLRWGYDENQTEET
ncbi:hypothetical protein Goshw_001482, partial [Gossypium schwendimanii]|nr:hypothetical protein [Gossypium schwendimanii]